MRRPDAAPSVDRPVNESAGIPSVSLMYRNQEKEIERKKERKKERKRNGSMRLMGPVWFVFLSFELEAKVGAGSSRWNTLDVK